MKKSVLKNAERISGTTYPDATLKSVLRVSFFKRYHFFSCFQFTFQPSSISSRIRKYKNVLVKDKV